MHGQAMALRGAADETLVEGDIGAQAGDLFIALGQGALQVEIGLAADLVGTLQGRDLLFEDFHALALRPDLAAEVVRARRDHRPQAPGPKPLGRASRSESVCQYV